MYPLISIVVPIYNVENFLDRCVQSIVSQTYRNLEILLIDDGSPDNSSEIAECWMKKDSRIKVYHKKNGGLSDARNYGLDRANGEYIAFVDSDDYIEPEMYETLMAAIRESNVELACCGRFYTRGDSNSPSRSLPVRKVLSRKDAIKELLNNGCIEEAAWDKLYSRELWSDLRFPINEINEDIVVTPQIIAKCSGIVHVGKPFYHYCYNGSSITKSGYNSKKDVMFRHMEELSVYVNKNFPEEAKYVDVLKAKYAMTTLFAIVLAQEEKKFPKSYKKYQKILRESYGTMLKCENFSNKQKLEALLLILGVYRVLWRLVQALK